MGKMKRDRPALHVVGFGVVLALGLSAARPPAPSQRFEGVKVIAAGAINPPNPVTSCDAAKQDAKKKAAQAGFNGRVAWDRLSVDSDCKLDIQGARGMGYYYIFTARGEFIQ